MARLTDYQNKYFCSFCREECETNCEEVEDGDDFYTRRYWTVGSNCCASAVVVFAAPQTSEGDEESDPTYLSKLPDDIAVSSLERVTAEDLNYGRVEEDA